MLSPDGFRAVAGVTATEPPAHRPPAHTASQGPRWQLPACLTDHWASVSLEDVAEQLALPRAKQTLGGPGSGQSKQLWGQTCLGTSAHWWGLWARLPRLLTNRGAWRAQEGGPRKPEGAHWRQEVGGGGPHQPRLHGGTSCRPTRRRVQLWAGRPWTGSVARCPPHLASGLARSPWAATGEQDAGPGPSAPERRVRETPSPVCLAFPPSGQETGAAEPQVASLPAWGAWDGPHSPHRGGAHPSSCLRNTRAGGGGTSQAPEDRAAAFTAGDGPLAPL